MGEPVLTDFSDGIATITINRPEVRNAIDRAVAEGIDAALDDLESRDDLQVAILTGTGPTFCAGMDLKAFGQGERPNIAGKGFAGLAERELTKPIIAAVEGYALAGGCEISLACDLIVAARDAQFGLTEVRRGLVAAAGGLLRLPKALPHALAMKLALTGGYIDGESAHSYGMIAELTEPGGALAAARELAAVIAANGPLAVRTTKRIVRQAAVWDDDELFAWQREVTEPVFTSEDAKEGAAAFVEKRDPVWTGR